MPSQLTPREGDLLYGESLFLVDARSLSSNSYALVCVLCNLFSVVALDIIFYCRRMVRLFVRGVAVCVEACSSKMVLFKQYLVDSLVYNAAYTPASFH